MRICFIGKIPPIQGGVCTRTYWMAYALAKKGHQVWVVTNANEAEPACRMVMLEEDRRRLELDFPNGGAVRCVSSEPPGYDLYVPWANPYVTKLAAMATDVVREHSCELVYAYYLEPYGIAAHLAAQWAGVPYVLAHAGSDVSVLMKRPWLRTAYAEILKAAHRIVTAEGFVEMFESLGVRRDQLTFLGFDALPTHVYSPEAPPLDVGACLERALEDEPWIPELYRNRPAQTFDPSVPTLGMYGKVAKAKGMFDFVSALGRLGRRGLDFQAVLVAGGDESACRALVDHAVAQGVRERLWMLPFLAPWRVPQLINATTATCFLERGFFIDFHTPGVPREVLACGRCLVVSGEIHGKQGYRQGLVHEENALVVPDPRDHEALADRLALVVREPDHVASIGRAGKRVSTAWEDFERYTDAVESDFAGYLEGAR